MNYAKLTNDGIKWLPNPLHWDGQITANPHQVEGLAEQAGYLPVMTTAQPDAENENGYWSANYSLTENEGKQIITQTWQWIVYETPNI